MAVDATEIFLTPRHTAFVRTFSIICRMTAKWGVARVITSFPICSYVRLSLSLCIYINIHMYMNAFMLMHLSSGIHFSLILYLTVFLSPFVPMYVYLSVLLSVSMKRFICLIALCLYFWLTHFLSIYWSSNMYMSFTTDDLDVYVFLPSRRSQFLFK
jgi:hypothetical protein